MSPEQITTILTGITAMIVTILPVLATFIQSLRNSKKLDTQTTTLLEAGKKREEKLDECKTKIEDLSTKIN